MQTAQETRPSAHTCTCLADSCSCHFSLSSQLSTRGASITVLELTLSNESMSLRLAVSGAQVKQLKAVLHFLGKIGEACTHPALLGMTHLACSLSTRWRRRRAPH